MQDIIKTGAERTMTSRELAAIAEKRHDNVMRVCRDLRDTRVCPQIEEAPYVEKTNGQTYMECRLNQRDSYVVMARLSPEFTARLVDRWQDLEKQAALALPDFSSPAAAARAWAGCAAPAGTDPYPRPAATGPCAGCPSR